MMDQRISISEGRYMKGKKVEGLSLKKQNKLIQCMGDVRGQTTSS